MSSTLVALKPALAKQIRAAARICALLTEGASRRRCLPAATGLFVTAIRPAYSMSPRQFMSAHAAGLPSPSHSVTERALTHYGGCIMKAILWFLAIAFLPAWIIWELAIRAGFDVLSWQM